MNSYKQLIVNVGLIFFLTACGGSGDEVNDNTDIVDTGGSENTNEATALSGILFDAPIENMTYDSGSYQGVTTSEGKYNYNEGENVIFTLGNYQFSSVTGSELISLIQLLGAEEIDEQTLNLARLLQTIDQNDDEDVITLPDLSAVDLSSLNFQQTLENFENSDTVQTVLAATPNTDELISSGQALAHLLEQLEIYAANESFTLPELSEDLDEDGDGIADVIEDSDGDGVYNSEDAFPNDASESLDTDQDGTGDNADNDDDNDGTIDSEDAFPKDATETTDTDGDGVGDQTDAFPTDANETKDSDLDGVGDNSDVFPNDPD